MRKSWSLGFSIDFVIQSVCFSNHLPDDSSYKSSDFSSVVPTILFQSETMAPQKKSYLVSVYFQVLTILDCPWIVRAIHGSGTFSW